MKVKDDLGRPDRCDRHQTFSSFRGHRQLHRRWSPEPSALAKNKDGGFRVPPANNAGSPGTTKNKVCWTSANQCHIGGDAALSQAAKRAIPMIQR